MSQAVRWTGNTLVALVVLAMLFFFLGPHLLGINFFTIYSGSMTPAIPVGSVVVAPPVDASDVEVGDIITFRALAGADKIVTHRVYEVLPNDGLPMFRTAGDANAAPDGNAVPAENVIGKVWFHLPFLGFFSSFVRSSLGFLLFICLPALVITSLEARNIIIELRAMRKRTRWQSLPVAVASNPANQQPAVVEPSRQVVMMKEARSLRVREIVTRVSAVTRSIRWPSFNPVRRLSEQQTVTEFNPPTGSQPVVPETSNTAVILDTMLEAIVPVLAEPSGIITEMKKKPEIEAEAAKIVGEIMARIGLSGEGIAKQKSSLSPEPKATISIPAIAVGMAAGATTEG